MKFLEQLFVGLRGQFGLLNASISNPTTVGTIFRTAGNRAVQIGARCLFCIPRRGASTDMNSLFKTLLLVLLSAPLGAANQGGSGKNAAALDFRARDLLARATRVMDNCFDDRAALVRPITPLDPAQGSGYCRPHLIRDTGWYTVGLLLRDRPGDRDCAVRVLNAVLDQQIAESRQESGRSFQCIPLVHSIGLTRMRLPI